MPRKSKLDIAADSAIQNLECIEQVASEGSEHAVYLRNANDCRRWVVAILDANRPLPAFMRARGIPYFTACWNLPKHRMPT